MKPKLLFAMLVFMFTLTGCWNSLELTERAFVMAVALDKEENGKIRMTVQYFKPTEDTQGSSAKQGQNMKINITTVNHSVQEAVRDLINYVGRKAQWSHMRTILIGEELAKTDIISPIDFFYRDTEPRLSTEVVITEGRAARYLEVQPYIENTIAQQLRETQRMASRFSAMTVDANLLTMALQTKSQVGVALVPYVAFSKINPGKITVAGIACLKDGKLIHITSPEQTEYTLLLVGKFRSGVLHAACDQEVHEAITVHNSVTKTEAKVQNQQVRIQIQTNIYAAISEMKCTRIMNEDDERKWIGRIESVIQKKMEESLKVMQAKKMDVLGIGNQIYRQNPALWKRWKDDWPNRFEKAEFDIQVHLHITNHGIMTPKPVLLKVE